MKRRGPACLRSKAHDIYHNRQPVSALSDYGTVPSIFLGALMRGKGHQPPIAPCAAIWQRLKR